jgi:ABC-2 type transport system ATP-binding protein
MHDPGLLILDEPTTGLDPLMQQEFVTLIREACGAAQTVRSWSAPSMAGSIRW